ncbi:MAG TPA: spore germination lipoprotein GerD [Bacillales bacterium]|nr:spore germination lipoprotein GerD [Bacillales bacterium]
MKTRLILLAASVLFLIPSGCSGAATNAQGGNQMDYQETKRMMVDLLKTDEGKQAIRDVLSDPGMRAQLLMDREFVKKTIEDTFTSDEGKKYLKKLLKDPKFSKQLATTMMKQNKQMLMDLMQDPKYQDMMMTILQSPEMDQQFLQLMKSQKYRKQMQKEIAQSFQSPLFQARIASILRQVVNEEVNKGTTGQQAQSQQQQSGGGGSGGQQQTSQ